MRSTIARQGEDIEKFLTERNDLKSENDQLKMRIRKLSWLCVLFGSAALIMFGVMLIW